MNHLFEQLMQTMEPLLTTLKSLPNDYAENWSETAFLQASKLKEKASSVLQNFHLLGYTPQLHSNPAFIKSDVLGIFMSIGELYAASCMLSSTLLWLQNPPDADESIEEIARWSGIMRENLKEVTHEFLSAAAVFREQFEQCAY